MSKNTYTLQSKFYRVPFWILLFKQLKHYIANPFFRLGESKFDFFRKAIELIDFGNNPPLKVGKIPPSQGGKVRLAVIPNFSQTFFWLFCGNFLITLWAYDGIGRYDNLYLCRT